MDFEQIERNLRLRKISDSAIITDFVESKNQHPQVCIFINIMHDNFTIFIIHNTLVVLTIQFRLHVARTYRYHTVRHNAYDAIPYRQHETETLQCVN